MSWLRDHFYKFVFPALESWKPFNTSYDVAMADPFWPKVPKNHPFRSERYFWGHRKMPPEIRALHFYCKEKEFLFPYNHSSSGKYHYSLLARTARSIEAKRKELGCPHLMLMGRDVWLLEVLCQKMGYPSIYLPEISRASCNPSNTISIDNLICWLKQHRVTGDELFVDTGFCGSVFAKIQKLLNRNNQNIELKIALLSQDISYDKTLVPIYDRVPHPKMIGKYQKDPSLRPNQIFPNRQNARSEALTIEYLPKYFKSGYIRNNMVHQSLAPRGDIILCAILTSLVWRGIKDETEDPRKKRNFLSKRKPRPKKKTLAQKIKCNCKFCKEKLIKKEEKRRRFRRLAKKAKSSS